MDYELKALDRDDEAKDKKQSLFLITINTNVSPRDNLDAQSLGEVLESIVADVFSKDDVEEWVKFLGDEGPEAIDSVKGGYGVELGKSQGRLHIHIQIEIIHETKVQINLKYVRERLREELAGEGIHGFHLDVKAVRGGEYSIRNYILKDL